MSFNHNCKIQIDPELTPGHGLRPVKIKKKKKEKNLVSLIKNID